MKTVPHEKNEECRVQFINSESWNRLEILMNPPTFQIPRVTSSVNRPDHTLSLYLHKSFVESTKIVYRFRPLVTP